MVTPLPSADDVDLVAPIAEESRATAHAIATAVAPDGGLTDTQRMLLEALFPAMTGHEVDLGDFDPVGPEELGSVRLPRPGRRRLRTQRLHGHVDR